MAQDIIAIPDDETSKSEIVTDGEREVIQRASKGGDDKYGRFFLAALSSIPWVIPLALAANFKGELDQEGMNQAIKVWLKEHEGKIRELMSTTGEILIRFDTFGDRVKERIESPEYLGLVRRAFRTWNEADTEEKRQMIKKLLVAAGVITLCDDDQIRLFIDWIDRYHEAHFAVMKEVYQHPRITKGEIWDNLHPEGRPRDNSAKAKLFSYLTRELNMGGIIEINREVNGLGERMRAPRRTSSGPNRSDTMESPFEDSKEWVLSELGKEFVRYVMEDVDPQLASGEKAA